MLLAAAASCVDAPEGGEPAELDATEPTDGPALVDTIVHDYDDVIAPVRLTLRGEHGSVTELPRAAAIEAELAVLGEGTVELELAVLVSALGHEDVMIELDRVRLEPGEVLPLGVALGELPLQVAGGDAEVRFAARVLTDGMAPIDVQSPPLLVRFDAEHRNATVTVGERRHGSVDAALVDASTQLGARGRFVAPDGHWIVAEPTHAHAGADASATDELKAPSHGVFAPPDDRICTSWRVHYDDPLAGQDFLATAGALQPVASYAQVTIATPTLFYPYYVPGVQIWQGYLDAAGCTPMLQIPNGYYVFSIGSKLQRDGVVYDVRFNQTTANYNGYSNGNFTINGAGTLTIPTVGDNRATRVATLVSRALVTPDLPIAAAFGFNAYAELGCPSTGNGACYSGSTLYVGDNNFGHDLSARRHVVLHEFGHGVQYRAIGGLVLNYDAGNSADPDCACDHVASANTFHCLQSRETINAAFTEGFAHFLAAKVFNDAAGNNCWFGYYKEFLKTDGTVQQPPVAINCQTNVKWMEARGCEAADRGTEYDWMNFMWDANATGGGLGTPLATFWTLMREACGGGCGGGSFTWASFAAAVDASPDLTDTQKWWLTALGGLHGVDH